MHGQLPLKCSNLDRATIERSPITQKKLRRWVIPATAITAHIAPLEDSIYYSPLDIVSCGYTEPKPRKTGAVLALLPQLSAS